MADNKQGRGFASMDEKKQRDIASKGGSSVAPEDRSFSRDRELASEAGRKGGEASSGNRSADSDGGKSGGSGNFTDDRERASDAGRKGGQSSRGRN